MTMSVRSKLLATFALNLVLMAVLGVFAVFQVENLRAKTAFVGNDVVPSLQVISDIQEFLTAYQRFQAEHLADADIKGRTHLEQELTDVEQEMTRLFAQYSALPVTDEERVIFDHIQLAWPNFVNRTRQELLTASRANDLATGRQVFAELDVVFEDMNSSVNKLQTLYDTQATEAAQASQATAYFARNLILSIAILAFLVAAVLGFFISSSIAGPIGRLTDATLAIVGGDLNRVVDVQSSDELGKLATTFNQMTTYLRTTQAAIAEQQRTLEEKNADLQCTFAELRESVTAREQLSATVRELSNPIIPVLDGILVMPLVGVIDAQRAMTLIDTLLRGVERHLSSRVILDVTGVPIIDSNIAQVLLNAASAAKLLGAEMILVGLRPELAQTIVGLGLDLTGLSVQADLQGGVRYAMRQQHLNAQASQ